MFLRQLNKICVFNFFQCHCLNVWIRETYSFMRHVDFRFYVVLESSTSHITNDWAMCCNDNVARRRQRRRSSKRLLFLFSLSVSFVLDIYFRPTIAIYNYPILYAVKLRRAKVNKTVGSGVSLFFLFLVRIRSSFFFGTQMLTTFVTQTYFDRSITNG